MTKILAPNKITYRCTAVIGVLQNVVYLEKQHNGLEGTATAFYRTYRRCKNYFCLVRLLQTCTKQNHRVLVIQLFRMARLVRATRI